MKFLFCLALPTRSTLQLWTCGQQLKDVYLDIEFRTPLEDKNHAELSKQFQN